MFRLLLVVVLLAPLPLGSNRPLPASALAAAVGLLLCAWGLCRLLPGSRRAGLPVRPLWPAFGLVGIAAGWAALQAAPFTPAALHHPYWREAHALLGLAPAGAISINPAATWNRLMGLLAYAGIFWLALQACRSSTRAYQVLTALAAGGLLYAAYGLFEALGSETGVVTSTFVNRNSYATYAGITLFCGLGLALGELHRRGRAGASFRDVALVVLGRLDARFALGAIACLVAGTALLLTQSRGGFVALCAALAAFVWSLRRSALIAPAASLKATAVLTLGLTLGLVWLAGEQTLGRFATDAQAIHRLANTAPPGRRSPIDRCSAPATAPTPTRSRPTTVRTPAPTSSTRRTTPTCRWSWSWAGPRRPRCTPASRSWYSGPSARAPCRPGWRPIRPCSPAARFWSRSTPWSTSAWRCRRTPRPSPCCSGPDAPRLCPTAGPPTLAVERGLLPQAQRVWGRIPQGLSP
ncbi:MAG TPA: hypothetical protein VK001_05975 [Geminicoccaceae bacterium]|nr:hypothetical protein [Geminicoccaceae bacterium]